MGKRVKHRTEPIERFPVKPRRDGRFQKRIHGHLYYFGSGDGDRTSAKAEYDLVKDDLYAGRPPRAWMRGTEGVGGMSVKDLCNRYLVERAADLDAGKISDGHYDDIESALKNFCTLRVGSVALGKRAVAELRPEDFAAFARHMGNRVGDRAFNRERANVMACFNHAAASDWLDRPVRTGKGFAKVSESKLRGQRIHKLLTPIHVKSLLLASSPQLWCMWMLGVLGGFGPGDCCNLRVDEIHWREGFIRSRRSKTGIRRDTPLTREVVDGLNAVIKPGSDLVFRTVRGNPWDTTDIDHEFAKIIRGFTPYDLRRAFLTYANETGDKDAIRRIVGWKLEGLDDTYVQTLFDDRLRAVVHYVRSRVLA